MFSYQSEKDLIYFLALCHIPTLGSVRLHKLFNHFADMPSLLACEASHLQQLGLKHPQINAIKKLDLTHAEQALSWRAADVNHHILTWFDDDYPENLQHIATKPPVLYIKGQRHHLRPPKIAMVGSRHPSASGLHTATILSQALSQQGLVITSGLALGIDAQAHQGALDCHAPTIAVLGTGLNTIYPRRHQKLAQAIAQQGLLVSEFPLNTQAKPQNFPQRNRIISGLSLGVVVIEAAIKSGSLITARYALEQNREVFAVPGNIHHALSRGPHALIRQGAKLVENIDDILEELPQMANATHNPHATKLNEAEQKLNKQAKTLLQLMAHAPISFDCLLEQSNLPIAQLSATLSHLQMCGLVQTNACGQLERIYEKRCA